LVAILRWWSVKWWPNVFGCHLTHLHQWLVIKKIWSPSNGVGVLDGDWKNSVTIWQWGYVKWQSNVFGLEKRGHVTCFWKAIIVGFWKKCHKPTFCGNWKISIAMVTIRGYLIFLCHHPTHPHHWMATIIFQLPKRAW
jgi:hypothetical protein